jgi:hypothetical protein
MQVQGSSTMMWKPRIVQSGDASVGVPGDVLFGFLWDGLVDLVGTAATAVLMRRAARRALPRSGELSELTISRVDGEYGYVVPPSFGRAVGPPAALRDLADELRPILHEFMGEVALRHLEHVPELRFFVSASPQLS